MMRALLLSAAVVASALALAAAPADAVGVPLAAQLDSLVKGFSGGAGIWIYDPASGAVMYQRDPDRKPIAASLYKLAVLAEVERLVEAKLLSYESVITIERVDITDDGSYVPSGTDLTIDEALELMVTVSDNGTALHLWRMVGPANISSTLAKAGMSAFHVAADDSDDNVATPRAVGRL
ncbi:MAG: serine hydrolase, partial [Chloroflexota bacterium]